VGRDYKKIRAFEVANRLVIEVYEVSKSFPRSEIFGITSQLRRAAVSIACNIVEGANRHHKKDYLHFLYIASGSCSETIYLLELANSIGYINENNYSRLKLISEEAGRVLYGLIEAVKSEI